MSEQKYEMHITAKYSVQGDSAPEADMALNYYNLDLGDVFLIAKHQIVGGFKNVTEEWEKVLQVGK